MRSFSEIKFVCCLMFLGIGFLESHPGRAQFQADDMGKLKPFYIKARNDLFFGPARGDIQPVQWKQREGGVRTLVGSKRSLVRFHATHKPLASLHWVAAGTVFRVTDIVAIERNKGTMTAQLKILKLNGKTPNFLLQVHLDETLKQVEGDKHAIFSEIEKWATRDGGVFPPAFFLVSKNAAELADQRAGDLVSVPDPKKISKIEGSKVRFKEMMFGDIHVDALISVTPWKAWKLNIDGGQIFTIVDYKWDPDRGFDLYLSNSLGVAVDDFKLLIKTDQMKGVYDPTKLGKLKLNTAKGARELFFRYVNYGKFRFSELPIDILP